MTEETQKLCLGENVTIALVVDGHGDPLSGKIPGHVAQFYAALRARGVASSNIHFLTTGARASSLVPICIAEPDQSVGALRYALFAGLYFIERALIRRRKKYKGYAQWVSMASLENAREIQPLEEMTDEVDVTVWFSGVSPSAQMASSTMDRAVHRQLGAIVQPLYGGRGQPFGFKEAREHAPSLDFSIIAHDRKQVDWTTHCVFRGSIMTANRWLVSHANLVAKLSALMAEWIVRGRTERQEALASDPVNPSVVASASFWPSIGESLSYAAQAFVTYPIQKMLTKQIRRRAPRWSVSYYQGDGFAQPEQVGTRIPNPSGGRFLADPFTVEYAGQSFCFVEDYFPDEKKGKISAYRLDETGAQDLGVVLEEPWHLSFPFLIADQGQIYMVPESSAAREIRIYKAHDFPNDWRLERVLMENIDAADSMIFKKGRRWYMLSNVCTAGRSDHQSELHLFSASNLLASHWEPCPHNPIICDPLRARNAGLFSREGRMYRVNQVQAQGQYGFAFQINEITSISPHHYKEKPIKRVDPDLGSGMARTHHFHIGPWFTVRDHAYWQKR